MKNQKQFSLEQLESRTLFAGAGDEVQFGGGSGLISGLGILFDHNDVQESQEVVEDVACHNESMDNEHLDVSEVVDKEVEAEKRSASRFDTSDFDWFFEKQRDSKIPEPRVSHKILKSKPGSGDSFWGYDYSKLTFSNFVSAAAEVTWEGSKILGELAVEVATVLNDHVIGLGKGTHRIKLLPLAQEAYQTKLFPIASDLLGLEGLDNASIADES